MINNKESQKRISKYKLLSKLPIEKKVNVFDEDVITKRANESVKNKGTTRKTLDNQYKYKR